MSSSAEGARLVVFQGKQRNFGRRRGCSTSRPPAAPAGGYACMHDTYHNPQVKVCTIPVGKSASLCQVTSSSLARRAFVPRACVRSPRAALSPRVCRVLTLTSLSCDAQRRRAQTVCVHFFYFSAPLRELARGRVLGIRDLGILVFASGIFELVVRVVCRLPLEHAGAPTDLLGRWLCVLHTESKIRW